MFSIRCSIHIEVQVRNKSPEPLSKEEKQFPNQWRIVARLKSGWAEGAWGTSPGGRMSPVGSRGAALVGVWGEALEARYIQTVCSCQMLFYAGLLRSLSYISPTPSPKTTLLDLPESHDPTRPRQGGHVPIRGYAIVSNYVMPLALRRVCSPNLFHATGLRDPSTCITSMIQ